MFVQVLPGFGNIGTNYNQKAVFFKGTILNGMITFQKGIALAFPQRLFT
jgi:hypothetical protein